MYPSRADLLETAVPYYLDSFRHPEGTRRGSRRPSRRSSRASQRRPRRPPRPPPPRVRRDEQKKAAATLTRLATELKEGSRGASTPARRARADGEGRRGSPRTASPRPAADYARPARTFEKYAAREQDEPRRAQRYSSTPGSPTTRPRTRRRPWPSARQLVKGTRTPRWRPADHLLLGRDLAAAREYAASAKYNQRVPDPLAGGAAPLRSPRRTWAWPSRRRRSRPTRPAATSGSRTTRPARARIANATARILYSAAKMQSDAKKPAEAKKTLQRAGGAEGGHRPGGQVLPGRRQGASRQDEVAATGGEPPRSARRSPFPPRAQSRSPPAAARALLVSAADVRPRPLLRRPRRHGPPGGRRGRRHLRHARAPSWCGLAGSAVQESLRPGGARRCATWASRSPPSGSP